MNLRPNLQNRRPANSVESDDSSSDWDTTVAESPVRTRIPKVSAPAAFKVDMNSDYATITAKPRTSLRGSSLIFKKIA